MAPAQKNNVIFPIACVIIWNEAPLIAKVVAKAAPRIIYES